MAAGEPRRAITSASAEAAEPRIRLVLELGRALHVHGTPAHRLEETLDAVARRLGLDGQFFSQPTSIFAAFGPRELQHTFLLRVEPGDVDLERLSRLEAVVAGLLGGTLDADQASPLLQRIEAARPPYPAALAPLAAGACSAAASRLLGGGAREIAAALLAGVAIGVFAMLAAGRPRLQRVFEPLAACLAAAITGALAHVVGPYSVYTATLAGLIVLIPGLALATAMMELSSRHLASGTARLSGAVMVFLAIGFGVALGGAVVDRALGISPAAGPAPLPGWTETLALLVAPLALMVLLRAPRRDAPWVLLTGVLAFEGGRLGAAALGPELGVLVGAFTAGAASNVYARLLRRPAAVPLVPALLLLVPGSVGFRSLALMLRSDVVIGVESAFRMTIMLSALVAGLLIANVVAPEDARRGA